MDNINLRTAMPVRNLQTFLRKISFYYSTVPRVVPDGIFGEQTKRSVIGFQQQFNLPQTGEVDSATWSSIVSVYKEILVLSDEVDRIQLYPSCAHHISRNSNNVCFYAIQAVIYAITVKFDNISNVTINGVYDEQTVEAVKQIQRISGIEETGNMDKRTWNAISGIYTTFVSRDRVEDINC